MLELQYDTFNMVAGFLHIPANVLWYRAASPSVAALSDDPIYVGPKYVADFYAKDPTRIYKTYRNPRPMRLLDVRFVQQIIPYLLTHRPEGRINAETMRWYKAMNIAFGSCTLRRQIELLREILHEITSSGRTIPPIVQHGITRMEQFNNHRDAYHTQSFVNPIETQGFRVGITDVDYYVISILRRLFTQVDGIISPALFTPYHDQGSIHRMFPEMVVFHPSQSLEEVSNTTSPDTTIALQHIIHQSTEDIFNVQLGYNYQTPISPNTQQGGDIVSNTLSESGTIDDREKILIQLRKGVKYVKQRYESALRFADSIEKNKLPAFLSRYIRKPYVGEMLGVLNWNTAMVRELS